MKLAAYASVTTDVVGNEPVEAVSCSAMGNATADRETRGIHSLMYRTAELVGNLTLQTELVTHLAVSGEVNRKVLARRLTGWDQPHALIVAAPQTFTDLISDRCKATGWSNSVATGSVSFCG